LIVINFQANLPEERRFYSCNYYIIISWIWGTVTGHSQGEQLTKTRRYQFTSTRL